MELGEGLLKDGTPDCSICANHCVDGAAIFLQGQVIVDDDCVRDAEGEEVNSVDAFRADLVNVVEEDLLHATRVLSDGRSGSHEPTVADRALANVCRPDARRSKERLACVCVFSSLPGGLSQVTRMIVDLLSICPVECIVAEFEVRVRVSCSCLVDVIEVFDRQLVAGDSTLADLGADFSGLDSICSLGKNLAEG